MRTLFNVAASALILIAATSANAACFRCAPIYNVADAPVIAAAGKALTDDEVKAAIVRAGSALGWQIKEVGPGQLIGTLVLRKHTAIVEIPYSSKQYSITYKSSIELDAADGQIHKNYNGWIQNLSRGINAQLTAG
ncbi:MAG: hypothetical protein JWP52_1464 [Rhizobacter sp.]|nr:hypothetical protein [Rhizobacter sp.]